MRPSYRIDLRDESGIKLSWRWLSSRTRAQDLKGEGKAKSKRRRLPSRGFLIRLSRPMKPSKPAPRFYEYCMHGNTRRLEIEISISAIMKTDASPRWKNIAKHTNTFQWHDGISISSAMQRTYIPDPRFLIPLSPTNLLQNIYQLRHKAFHVSGLRHSGAQGTPDPFRL